MDSSNIYDSVFKTMVHKAPKLLIPLINEAVSYTHLTLPTICSV